MKIECILIREGGTVAEIGGVSYHFAPSAEHDGRHVATVDHPVHAARFISITEGYRMVPEAGPSAEDLRAAAEAEQQRAQEAEAARLAAEQQQADEQARLTAEAEAQARAAADAVEAQQRAAEAAFKAAQAAKDSGPPHSPSLDAMTREQMVALHEQRFGRKPHHRLSDEKLRDLLAQPPAEG